MVEETTAITRYQSLGGALVSIDYQEVLLLQPAATPAEANLFLAACQGSRLNPHLREIFLVPFGGDKGGCSIHIGVWGHLKIAQQHSDYRGFEAGVIVRIKDSGELVNKRTELVDDKLEILYGGWAQVGRVDWITAPIEVKLETYKRGGERSRWERDPAGMIRKVALAKALGETYPLAQEPPPTEGVVLREWTDDDEEKLADLYPMTPQPAQPQPPDLVAPEPAKEALAVKAQAQLGPAVRDYAFDKYNLDLTGIGKALGAAAGVENGGSMRLQLFMKDHTQAQVYQALDDYAKMTGAKPPQPEASTEPATGPRPAPEGSPADTLTEADFV